MLRWRPCEKGGGAGALSCAVDGRFTSPHFAFRSNPCALRRGSAAVTHQLAFIRARLPHSSAASLWHHRRRCSTTSTTTTRHFFHFPPGWSANKRVGKVTRLSYPIVTYEPSTSKGSCFVTFVRTTTSFLLSIVVKLSAGSLRLRCKAGAPKGPNSNHAPVQTVAFV